MADKKLYLIDATAFCYRAFYAIKGLSTSFGQPTGAIYGFVNMLNKILKDNKPEYLAACFDVSRDTFRQKKFAEYKIQRPPMSEDLVSQIPLIKEIILAYGINIFEKAGFEADDIIATLAKKAKQKGLSVIIVTSDKDMLQLADDKTTIFSPYKDEGVLYNEKKVRERFGVAPNKIPDIIALMGDSSDNIPNVPGIGETTAADLIKAFGSLDKLLANLDQIKQHKLKDSIKNNIDTVRLNKELVVLDEKVDIDFDLDKLKIGEPNSRELFRIFKNLEFKKFLKDLPVEEEKAQDIKALNLEDKELKGLIKAHSDLFLYAEDAGGSIFYAQGKFFRVGQTGENLQKILSDPSIKKISHDLKKIKVLLSKDNIALEGLHFDTMVASYLLNPAKAEYSLNEAAWDYLGKVEKEKQIDAGQAVALILELRPKLEEELKKKELIKLFTGIEMPLVEVLAEMELNGIKLDLGLFKKISRDLEKKLAKLIEDIYAISGCQFNINSPKQLSQVLFEKLKLPVVKKGKTGPSTDEEVLNNLSAKHKLPEVLLEYRQLMKLKTTYIDTMPLLVDPKTGRVHTSFNQTGTETGRLSSSNPNLQNIPIKTDIGKQIRQAIISFSPKSYLLAGDYSQVELRILAYLAGEDNLISAFKEGKDIHKATASLIYGLGEEEVSDAMRDTAKRVNFGIIYGLSSYGLSRDLGISNDEAQNFIDAYFLRYPKVKLYIQGQIERAKRDGFVTTLLGRRRYIPEINNKNLGMRQFAQRQAVNTPIQGSASDLIKLAMVAIHNQLRSRKLKAKMIMQIHDELVFDCPEEELKELEALVKDKMENVLKLGVPIKVEIKKGKNWLEMEPV